MFIYIEDSQFNKRGWVAVEKTAGKLSGYVVYVNKKKPTPIVLGESLKTKIGGMEKTKLFKTFYQAYSAGVRHIYDNF